MSQGDFGQYRESIRIGADGFCFTLPGGERTIVVQGPCTAIPFLPEACTAEQAAILYNTVFPSDGKVKVLTDIFQQFKVTLAFGVECATAGIIDKEYGGIPVRSHFSLYLDRICRSPQATLLVARRGGTIDAVAADAQRLLYLNSIETPQADYEVLYYILNVWKAAGLKSGSARIELQGFDDNDTSIIRNLKLMTGENTVCVL